MLGADRLRRLLMASLCAAIGSVVALSSLDCTESDPPFPAPGSAYQFSLAESVYTVVEADTTVYVRVERSCGCDSAWVWATCSAGTATPGEDYVATAAQLAFGRGSAVESLPVHILADTTRESTEVLRVILGPASGSYEIADPDTAIIRIVDDDSSSTAPLAAGVDPALRSR